MRKNEIKAVELVRRIRDEHYEQLKDKSPEEQLDFYRKQAEELHKELKRTAGAKPSKERRSS